MFIAYYVLFSSLSSASFVSKSKGVYLDSVSADGQAGSPSNLGLMAWRNLRREGQAMINEMLRKDGENTRIVKLEREKEVISCSITNTDPQLKKSISLSFFSMTLTRAQEATRG